MTNKDIWLYLKSEGGSTDDGTLGKLIDKTLTEIVIPNNATAIASNVFQECPNLVSVTIPSNVTSIGYYAFGSCTNLKTVNIANGVTVIGEYAFRYCQKLEAIDIPSSVTAINSYAFQGCFGLKSVNISNGETIVGYQVFNNCNNLEYVTLADNFNCSIDSSNAARYSTDTLLNIFKSLKDRTGETAYTLKLGSYNLVKLTNEQKSIATNKNWVLS